MTTIKDLEKQRPVEFNIKGRKVPGELTVDRSHIRLTMNEIQDVMYEDDFSSLSGEDALSVKGIVKHTGTKVTLVKVISSFFRAGSLIYQDLDGKPKKSSYGVIHPEYAVFGDSHISPNEKTITVADFVVDGLNTIFRGASIHLGRVWDQNLRNQFIERIVEEIRETLGHHLEVGPYPEVIYSVGKDEIASVNTELGNVSVRCSQSTSAHGSTTGVNIENTFFVRLRFSIAVDFEEATRRAFQVINFIGLLAGRPQNLAELTLYKQELEERHQGFRVCPSNRRYYHDNPETVLIDSLIDGFLDTEEFSRVLVAYIKSYEGGNFEEARERWFDKFNDNHVYDPDCLVASANLFDLLPSHTLPEKPELPACVKSALEACHGIVDKLPEEWREAAMNALGNIDNLRLKQKINHRAATFTDKLRSRLPDIEFVISNAVDLRNFYVHGSKRSKISNVNHSDKEKITPFLTSTLEFVFAASDLIESGWNVDNWLSSKEQHHPFWTYLERYKENFSGLRQLFSP